MTKNTFFAALAAAFIAIGGGVMLADAQGIGLWPGFPAATSLTGDETIPADTNAAAGTVTELITTSQLRGAFDGSNSFRNFAACNEAAEAAADFTNATPVVTEVYISEIFVPIAGTVTGVAMFNGSDATDSVNVALADSTGAIVANSDLAGTQQVGTDTYQRVPFTSTYSILPGTYYILAQFDGTTTRYNALAVGNCGASKQTGQTFGTFTSITPPTTFTADHSPVASLY